MQGTDKTKVLISCTTCFKHGTRSQPKQVAHNGGISIHPIFFSRGMSINHVHQTRVWAFRGSLRREGLRNIFVKDAAN